MLQFKFSDGIGKTCVAIVAEFRTLLNLLRASARAIASGIVGYLRKPIFSDLPSAFRISAARDISRRLAEL